MSWHLRKPAEEGGYPKLPPASPGLVAGLRRYLEVLAVKSMWQRLTQAGAIYVRPRYATSDAVSPTCLRSPLTGL